jgi:hypothetical protein
MARKLAVANKLPKELYTFVEQDGDSEYFITNDNLEQCATFEEERIIGVYALVRTVKVSAKADVKTLA